jgi:phosphoglycolate phosphatase
MQGFTVVFDLDGTLVDTAPDLIGATNHALEQFGLSPVAGGVVRPWISFGARRMIVEALASSGATLPGTGVDQLLEHFLQYYEANIARDSRPYPGAIEAAEALIILGARLAICTNKRQSLSEALLAELGIRSLFHGLAGRDAFDVCKPHPGHLLGAIKLVGGDPGHAVMVGDSEVDVATAKAAGVPVIAVTFGYTQVPVHQLDPDGLISQYNELIPAVAAVRSSMTAKL